MTSNNRKYIDNRHVEKKGVPVSPLLLINIRQLLTLRSSTQDSRPRRGPELSELGLIEEGAVLCAGGKIVAVGKTRDALRDRWLKINKSDVEEVDCRDMVVLPGFVDSHTHPVFAAPRLVDFEKRISGASYEEIATAGGGIRSSISGVRQTAKTVLTEETFSTFEEMAVHGTTTIEAKSGYGLSIEAELKSLQVIKDAARRWPGTVVATLLGAHVIPPEFQGNRAEYVRLICEKMIPQAVEKKLASYVDVFCERGAYTKAEAEQIFTAAQVHGLGVRAHVCQMTPAALSGLLKFKPASFDHLDCVKDEDIPRLAQHDTVATLLPGADYFLGFSQYPPARRLIDTGVPVALATDFNPGTSPTISMPMVMSLACTHMKMSPAEVIVASTYNGAFALRLHDRKGSLEAGKDADLCIFDVRDYREIPYWFGSNRCAGVVLNGELQA